MLRGPFVAFFSSGFAAPARIRNELSPIRGVG
jgi:hypothetical protein